MKKVVSGTTFLLDVKKKWCLTLLFFLCSCASSIHRIQPQVQNNLVANQPDKAIHAFDKGPASYGARNELLFWLDRGLVLHSTGHYQESIESFEQAKRIYNALYGNSAMEVAGSALVNDYWKSYRGEDYEYILVNVFQALNYAALDNIDEALADIRRLDYQLGRINARYTKEQANIYSDDAFGRMLGGMLYEASGHDGFNDAYISNSKAFDVYKNKYLPQFGIFAPRLLKSNLLTTSHFMGVLEYGTYHSQFPDIPLVTATEKQHKAIVYIIEYTGFVPLKTEDWVVIPLDATHFSRLAFARALARPSQVYSATAAAQGAVGVEVNVQLEIGEDIGAIMQKVLEQKKGWMLTKGLLRPAAKYALERTAEEQLRQHDHDMLALLFNLAGDVYNVVSEKADLREWETLPDQIRVGMLILDPGTYTITVKDHDYSGSTVDQHTLGTFSLTPGTTKFLISRSYR